jgi:hypothetical protein
MDILNLLIGFILGIPASIAGTYFYLVLSKKKGNKHLREIFNFGSDAIIFVFTHGGHVPQAILPRTSTEAFIAVNNLIGTLINTGLKGPIRVRDTSHIDGHDRTKNLVIVTGPKSNSFTGEVLSNIKQQVPSLFEFEKVSDNPEQWQILSDIYKCPSPSYEQEAHAITNNKEVATQKLEDVAMIIKATNPWNGANKIFIVAGVRGIGTWGAAEYLRKHANDLYQAKSGSGKFKKNGNFAALLKVTYHNFDIVRVELRQLIDIS